MMQHTQKRLVIIAGMHRSGTSAVTGVLECLGVNLGDDLAPAMAAVNAKGYKEDVNVIKLHERLLWSCPTSWDSIIPAEPVTATPEDALHAARNAIGELLDDKFASHSIVGIKDPRISLFLPLWLEVAERKGVNLSIVIPVRMPEPVAQSLARRDMMYLQRARLLYSKYLLCAEKYTRDVNRVFVSYEELLASPRPTVETLVRQLGLEVDDAQLTEAVGFLAPSLNHARSKDGTNDQDVAAFDLDERLRNAVVAYCSDTGSRQSLQAIFDEGFAEYEEYLRGCDPVLLDQIQHSQQQAMTFRTYWQDALHSRPLRLAYGLRKLLKRVTQVTSSKRD